MFNPAGDAKQPLGWSPVSPRDSVGGRTKREPEHRGGQKNVQAASGRRWIHLVSREKFSPATPPSVLGRMVLLRSHVSLQIRSCSHTCNNHVSIIMRRSSGGNWCQCGQDGEQRPHALPQITRYFKSSHMGSFALVSFWSIAQCHARGARDNQHLCSLHNSKMKLKVYEKSQEAGWSLS